MLFGFDSFAAQPFAATNPQEGQVTVNVVKNQLQISIGNVNITADSIIEDVTKNQLALGLGTLVISGTANVTTLKNELNLGIGNFVVTADANASVTKNSLTLTTRSVIVTGTAVVNPTPAQLSLKTVEPGVITWNNIIPGVNMVWTPIVPY